MELLGLPQNIFKDCQRIVVIVFGLEIDTSLFTAQLPVNKREKKNKVTLKGFSQEMVSFINIQSLIRFLSFCFQAIRRGRVFIKKRWNFINHYLCDKLKFMPKKISTWVKKYLE